MQCVPPPTGPEHRAILTAMRPAKKSRGPPRAAPIRLCRSTLIAHSLAVLAAKRPERTLSAFVILPHTTLTHTTYMYWYVCILDNFCILWWPLFRRGELEARRPSKVAKLDSTKCSPLRSSSRLSASSSKSHSPSTSSKC